MNSAPQHNQRILEAARWYAANRDMERAFVPVLRERFRLTAIEAIEAAKLSRDFPKEDA